MSATDSRYEDAAFDDESTRNDPDSEARDSVLNDGPVLLPVDAETDKTDDSSSLRDHDPIVDSEEAGAAETRSAYGSERVGGEVTDLDDGGKDASPAFTTDSTGVTTDSSTTDSSTTDSSVTDSSVGSDTEVTTDSGPTTDTGGDTVVVSDVTSDDKAETVGPDTETGALKDPVPAGSFAASDSTDTTAAPSTASDVSAEWLELQGRFVDDPQAAVKEAGAKVEQALSDLRARIETGSTEDLRTAFRRYRELHAGLS
jgi:hypothetical protein